MAIFQGENLAFKIILKDSNGSVIETTSIDDISAKLYNEAQNKVYIEYALGNGDSGILDRTIIADDDHSGFLFEIYGVDSAILLPGRYIIQIEYKVSDSRFPKDNDYKIYKQKGALITINKAL